MHISIHAPQWGATGGELDGQDALLISIHAPQWGATGTPSQRTVDCRFQSTHPSGVRLVQHPRVPAAGRISIHAPQWGATVSRPAKLMVFLFQSTHPSGVRRAGRRGRGPQTQISIHAPQWGATYVTRGHIGVANISIHAPQWGATARMGIAFHNMEAPSVLKTDFIAKIHVHRSIHKFSNQKHQQTIHF